MLWWQYYLLEFLGHEKHTVEPFHELHSQFIATFSVPPTLVRSCHEKQAEELARTIPKRFTFPFEGRNCYAQAQDNGQQTEDISSQLTHFQFRWRARASQPKPKLNQIIPNSLLIAYQTQNRNMLINHSILNLEVNKGKACHVSFPSTRHPFSATCKANNLVL